MSERTRFRLLQLVSSQNWTPRAAWVHKSRLLGPTNRETSPGIVRSMDFLLSSLIFLALVCTPKIAHQIFKRYETYSIRSHATLLQGPPTLIASSDLSHSTRSLLSALFVCHIVYLGSLSAFIILYRISPFHPLAHYSGPISCKVSQWWMAYISLTGYEHLYITELHRKYGDVVRIGPNEISIRHPSAVAPVMALAKGPQYHGRMLSDGTHLPLIGIQDVDDHLRRRRPWNRAFSASALKEYEETIAGRARMLVSALERKALASQEVVLGKWFNYFAYDFMCDMAFGGGSELLQGGDENNVWKILDEGMVIGTLLAHVPWLGIYLSHIPLATGPLDTLISHCRNLTKQRIQRGSTRKDLFHFLNNEDLPDGHREHPAPIRQLTDDGCLVVVAGADTTSSALTSLFFCLLTHPETYMCLRAEVDRFYPVGEDALNPRHHRDMGYLNAVINETLRLFPPVPGGSQRQVLHHQFGAQVGTTYVPPGTSVWVHTYSLQRDPRNFFPHPDAFWPERWLLVPSTFSSTSKPSSPFPLPSSIADTTISPSDFKHNESAFIPFAAGAMNCVGKNLALQEIRMVVVALMQRFEMQLREGWDASEYERGFRAYLVATRPEVPVRLRVRRHPCK
ncbi:cytochrome P450 [Fomes fomentarius]|nr:cytochrome P450 [Fomes fomentarius]